jgi:hypothetical protein
MTPEETKILFDLAKSWQSAADLHKKAMRRNRSFANSGRTDQAFYLGEAARDEIRAELYESQAKKLEDVVSRLSGASIQQADSISA